jgi:glycosyltransferase involved in cell wall biosynthesis
MTEPQVSVVMAAFDAEDTIAEAIDSVVQQTHADWELRIIDDGSRDRTAEIARSFGDERIRVDSIDHVGVLAVVRNRAIAAGSAAYVAFLDADDVWYPKKIEKQLAALEDAQVGLVNCLADRLEGGRRVPSQPPPPGATELDRLARENYIVSSSVIVRRTLLDAHGLFDEDPALRGSPDYELWLRLAPHTVFRVLSEPLLAYRVHERQMSSDRAAMDSGALVALGKARRHNPADAATLTRSIGILRCVNGLPGRGRRELLGALRARPTDALAWGWLARATLGTKVVGLAARAARLRRR